jgi:hypothetical protein
MTPTRRNVLLGGAALAALAAVPVALGGTESFLRRVLADHFGPDVLEIEGIDDFIRDYAAQAGAGSFAKRIGAEVYFAWRGDLAHMITPAQELEKLFLQTILTRSNIVALHQGRDELFSYINVDPWEPTCGLYLSALAEDASIL